MNISDIQEHMPVYVDGPGGLAGASEMHIGNIDAVEGGKYLKLTLHDVPEKSYWCGVDLVRAVDERAVYLNTTINDVMSELSQQQPEESLN